MSVTLSEVKRAARAHRAPLAGESAGYLVLALADQVLSAPRLIAAGDVQLTDEGGLRVLRGQASSEADAELSLRRALDGLLLVASSGSAALMRAGRRVTPVGLPGLVRELEAALIPVNRAAARRALARLQRETARALASGTLAAEEPELPPLSAPNAAPVIEAAVCASSPTTEREESQALAVAVPAEPVDLPPALWNLDGVLSAVCDAPAASVEDLPSDALTIALDVQRAPLEAPTTYLDEDVELVDDVEVIEEEPSDALTWLRDIAVQPVAASGVPASGLVELPEEACTRPEPVIVRRALRPQGTSDLAPASHEAVARTPTLGSLAAELPVLTPELIAEMTRRELSAAVSAPEAVSAPVEASPGPPPRSEPSAAPTEPEAGVVCSASSEDCTEPMPEVAPLSPGVAIVASRQSEVSELVADFHVVGDDTHQDLRRAIKELADLDLTPAPFAALIR